jgi:hypothetical protein
LLPKVMKNNSNHRTEIFSGNSVWKIKVSFLAYDESAQQYLSKEKYVQLKIILN